MHDNAESKGNNEIKPGNRWNNILFHSGFHCCLGLNCYHFQTQIPQPFRQIWREYWKLKRESLTLSNPWSFELLLPIIGRYCSLYNILCRNCGVFFLKCHEKQAFLRKMQNKTQPKSKTVSSSLIIICVMQNNQLPTPARWLEIKWFWVREEKYLIKIRLG